MMITKTPCLLINPHIYLPASLAALHQPEDCQQSIRLGHKQIQAKVTESSNTHQILMPVGHLFV